MHRGSRHCTAVSCRFASCRFAAGGCFDLPPVIKSEIIEHCKSQTSLYHDDLPVGSRFPPFIHFDNGDALASRALICFFFTFLGFDDSPEDFLFLFRREAFRLCGEDQDLKFWGV